MWVGVLQGPSETHVPVPHRARPRLSLLEGSEGPEKSTWRKEETPGAGLGGPLCGGALSPSLPFPLFPCVRRLRWRRASQAREGAMGEAPPSAAPS